LKDVKDFQGHTLSCQTKIYDCITQKSVDLKEDQKLLLAAYEHTELMDMLVAEKNEDAISFGFVAPTAVTSLHLIIDQKYVIILASLDKKISYSMFHHSAISAIDLSTIQLRWENGIQFISLKILFFLNQFFKVSRRNAFCSILEPFFQTQDRGGQFFADLMLGLFFIEMGVGVPGDRCSKNTADLSKKAGEFLMSIPDTMSPINIGGNNRRFRSGNQHRNTWL
jgi:hypothetical protein